MIFLLLDFEHNLHHDNFKFVREKQTKRGTKIRKAIMITVKVEILRIIDNSFPVFVECVLVDCNGKKHYFHDKLPVFSLDCNTEVPRVGEMGCRIIQDKQDTLVIGTLLPDGIESTNEEYRFEVYKSQISEKY